MKSQARAVSHPILSSPGHLSLACLGVTLVVYAVQLASGVPPWTSGSPVELSSNVVAAAGLAWALIQLRAAWGDGASRLAWAAAAGGMALLTVEGYVGPLFMFETHGQEEMGVSIAIWLVAAVLLFSTSRRFAMRRSVEAVTRCAFAIQVGAQLTGLWAATLAHPEGDLLEYLNDTGELVAVLAYLMALLLAVFAPDKSYRFPLEAIGAKARGIVRDFRLQSIKGPGALWRAIGTRCASAASLVRCWARSSSQVRRDGGPSRTRQLLEMLHVGLIGGVDPEHYYRLRLFGDPKAASGVMTTEPGSGLALALRRESGGPDVRRGLDDGEAFARILAANGLASAPILATVSAGALRPADGGWALLDQDLAIRPRSTSASGPHLTLARIGPMVFRDPSGDVLNVEMAASRLGCASAAGDLLVGPRLRDHDDVAPWARSCALDFQAVTCLDEAGEPRVTHGALRIRQPSGPGCASGGRPVVWGAPIDLQTGVYGALVGDGLDGGPRLTHPATRELIAGRTCAGWRAIAELAVAAHRLFDDDVVVCWTILWTSDGPCLVKGETDLDLSFVQGCYGAPIGRSPLAPLLDWRLDRMVGGGARAGDAGTQRREAGFFSR